MVNCVGTAGREDDVGLRLPESKKAERAKRKKYFAQIEEARRLALALYIGYEFLPFAGHMFMPTRIFQKKIVPTNDEIAKSMMYHYQYDVEVLNL